MRILNRIFKIFDQNSLASKSLWQQELEKKDPTKPINFGYKWSWAAVKTEDTDALLRILNLKELKKANWIEGYIKGFEGDVFVLPPIAAWILIMGNGLPAPCYPDGTKKSEEFLRPLSRAFGDAQLFGNHRVTGTAFWMKSINDQIERLYAISDGYNAILGEPTTVEKKWELYDSNSLEIEEEAYQERAIFPDVEHVLMVAENWSINPNKIEDYEHIGAFGYVGVLS